MKAGMTVGMSGRDMFTFDPKMMSNMVCKFILKIKFFRMMMTRKVVKHTICLKCQGKMVKKMEMIKLKFMKLNLMNLELWTTD